HDTLMGGPCVIRPLPCSRLGCSYVTRHRLKDAHNPIKPSLLFADRSLMTLVISLEVVTLTDHRGKLFSQALYQGPEVTNLVPSLITFTSCNSVSFPFASKIGLKGYHTCITLYDSFTQCNGNGTFVIEVSLDAFKLSMSTMNLCISLIEPVLKLMVILLKLLEPIRQAIDLLFESFHSVSLS